MFARPCVTTAGTFLVSARESGTPEEENTHAAMFAFVQGCQCVYSACDIISECVSYDVPPSDEVLSTSAGVCSLTGTNHTRMLFISQRE